MVMGALCTLAGVMGSVMPILPGPPLSYVGLLLLQFTRQAPFGTLFLIIYAVLTVTVTLLMAFHCCKALTTILH